eukprot:TRINITY_DN6003_c0_g2_i1.p1 TRINITY_DN6003_c0_g2~~TRINITY_DN6003_c0_g2_i1.p1  ORF type:complete len:175 (+),score=40.06 TRINITY_DN6003_c0_g2_i1:77-601(+)
MAFSRLFGKSSKKDPPSPSGSNNSPDLSERETDDFTLVENNKNVAGGAEALAATFHNISKLPYPALPNQSNTSPYPALPPIGGGVGYPPPGGGGGHNANSNTRPASAQNHPLDGVQFQLSPRLATDSQLDQIVVSVESVMSRVKNVDWASLDYNFTLERSILSTDISMDGVKIN